MSFGKIRSNASLTIYTCNICGCRGRAGEQTQWYGSLKDEEDGTLICVCSDDCMKKIDNIEKVYAANKGEKTK